MATPRTAPSDTRRGSAAARGAAGTTLVAAALAALLVIAGGAVGTVGGQGPGGGASTGKAGKAAGGRVAALELRVRALPGDHHAWAALGLAYVQQARRSGDPTLYPRADQALRRSLDLAPGNVAAQAAMSALAAARHDFTAALAWGERARTASPHDATANGVVGDALAELGRYRDAFASWQRMVDLRPDLASYARVSYAWELQGDPVRAIDAMGRALAAAGDPADAAWAAQRLGELHWQRGEPSAAAEAYRGALRLDPTDRLARAGLARVAAAQGEVDRAIRDLRRLVAEAPLPEHVALLRELAVATGRDDLIAEQEALLDAGLRLLRASGARIDLESARITADRFLLDAQRRSRHRSAGLGIHGTPAIAEAVRAARAEWGRRRSIQAADALAWALLAQNRPAQARPYAARAVRLGTRDASLWFHKGMIELAAGDRTAARHDLATALAINPSFSPVWSGVARRALRAMSPARMPGAA